MSRRRGVLADTRLGPGAGDLARALDRLIAGAEGGRIGRGLGLAGRSGGVGDLEFEPGAVRAFVAGSRGGRYRVTVGYPAFDRYERAAWEYVTGDGGYGPEAAAGTFTRELLHFAEASGCPMVPDPGDLDADCECPDPDPVCKHLIAVLKTFVAEADRSEVILLRARGVAVADPVPAAIGDAGRTRWAATVFEDGPAPAEAFARRPGPLPEAPRLPWEPDPPCFHDGPWDPGRFTAEITADRLDLQAAVAVKTAFAALDAAERGSAVPLRPDDPGLDAARVAAVAGRQVPTLARFAGCTPLELEDRGYAWRYGGAEGVGAVAEEWTPDRDRCREADERFGGATRRRNRWTFTGRGRQLRLGRDGRWYPFAKVGNRWRPAAPPCAGLDDAVHWVETARQD